MASIITPSSAHVCSLTLRVMLMVMAPNAAKCPVLGCWRSCRSLRLFNYINSEGWSRLSVGKCRYRINCEPTT